LLGGLELLIVQVASTAAGSVPLARDYLVARVFKFLDLDGLAAEHGQSELREDLRVGLTGHDNERALCRLVERVERGKLISLEVCLLVPFVGEDLQLSLHLVEHGRFELGDLVCALFLLSCRF